MMINSNNLIHAHNKTLESIEKRDRSSSASTDQEQVFLPKQCLKNHAQHTRLYELFPQIHQQQKSCFCSQQKTKQCESQQFQKRDIDSYLEKEQFQQKQGNDKFDANQQTQGDKNIQVNELITKFNLLFQKQDLPGSAKQLCKLIAIDPKNANLHFSLAAILMKIQKFLQAATHLSIVIRLNPNCVDAYWRYGNCLVILRRYQQARKYYQEGLKLVPDHKACIAGLTKVDLGLLNQRIDRPPNDKSSDNKELADIVKDVENLASVKQYSQEKLKTIIGLLGTKRLKVRM